MVEDKLVKVHWFKKSERLYLCEHTVCWMCCYLIYCSECKRFECALNRDKAFALPKVLCVSRKDADVCVL